MSMENLNEQLYEAEMDGEYAEISKDDIEQEAALEYMSSHNECYSTISH